MWLSQNGLPNDPEPDLIIQLLSTSCVPGTAPGTGDTKLNKTQSAHRYTNERL